MTRAEDKAGEALRDERAAQDRVREHAEYARQMQEAWKRVQGRGGPREQADALRESQNAVQVAQGEQAACEGKAAARALADRDLETARAKGPDEFWLAFPDPPAQPGLIVLE